MPPSPDPSRRGLFFSFEGIDGSGKSTQATLLAEWLLQTGYPVLAVREPGGTPLGEEIRRLLLDPDTEAQPRAELLLFAAARAQLVQTVIRPALDSGTHVVADRYIDSTVAYQGAGRRLATSIDVDGLSALATGGLEPDRTYLITIPLDEAARRRSTRQVDRMEQQADDFRERVAGAYQEVADRHQRRVVTFDGRMPISDIQRSIQLDALKLITTHKSEQIL